MTTARPHAEIIELQYLRAIAVLMVVVGHLHQAGERFFGASLFGPAGYTGFAGVDVFFVISGFIIHTLYRDAERPSASYLLKRLNRIFPLYWVFTALAVLGYLVMGDGLTRGLSELDWVSSLTLLPTGQPPLLLVGWTLTHELYFYLVYAIALFIPGRWRWLGGLAWAALTVLVMTPLLQPQSPWLQLALSPFNLLFLAGIILVELRERLVRMPWSMAALAAIGALIAISWTGMSGLDGMENKTHRVLAFLGLAVGMVAALLAWQPRWPSLLARIGDWSYAIYLGHLLVIGVLARLIAQFMATGLPGMIVLYGLGFGGSIVMGLIVHRLVEQPLLARGKALIARAIDR